MRAWSSNSTARSICQARRITAMRTFNQVALEHQPEGADRDERVTLRVAETEPPFSVECARLAE